MSSLAYSQPEDWGSYWQKNWITSFAEQFPHNYDGPIRDFWRAQLTGTPRHVVDLACGNGALAWIADELLNKPAGSVRITGVDYAPIDPFRALGKVPAEHPNVGFIGNTPAESLPFPDESIDLVISQYGIEYADLDRAVPEIGRVLKPSGRMAFIMHDAESSVVSDATRYLEDFEAVLDFKIHDFALELIALRSRLATPEERRASAEFAALAAQINQLASRVHEIVSGHRTQSAIHKYMDELMRVLADPQAVSAPDAADRIAAARDSYRAHVRKMAHMRSAALSADDRQHLVELIAASGYFVTEMAAISYRHESNIGTGLVAGPAR